MAAMQKTAKTPTVAIARALRSLGLKQGGTGRDFTVTGTYRNGERVDTFVILYTRNANETVAKNADTIEAATAEAGFYFRVNVYNHDGKASSSIANMGQKIRESVPGITEQADAQQILPAPAVTEAKPTKYQRTHRPIRVVQILCVETGRLDGVCVECGRHLDSRAAHKPQWNGSLGYVQHYADGSSRVLPAS